MPLIKDESIKNYETSLVLFSGVLNGLMSTSGNHEGASRGKVDEDNRKVRKYIKYITLNIVWMLK